MKKESLKLSPENVTKFQQAMSFHQRGQLESAEVLYKEILQTQPTHIDALHFLGVIAFQRGQYQHAIDLIGQAISINPNNSAAYSNRGNAFFGLKRYEEALDSYDCALNIKPDYADALSNRGNALKELKRYEEALFSYDRAISIKPDYADAHSNRGNTLKELKRYEEALDSYDRAVNIKPDYVDALSNRGNVLKELKRYEEALDSYDRAVNIKPDYVEALYNRGTALNELKRYEEALNSYGLALNIKPDYEFLLGRWLHLKMILCDWSEFDINLNKLEQGIERGEKVSPPFSIQAVSSSSVIQKNVSCCYTQAKHPSNFLLPPLVKHIHSKIKIGYFSSDFRKHPVADLTVELFECHNRSQFEIIAFSFHAAHHKDDMRLRLERAFDQFIDVSQQSDEQIVQLARQLEIDIAIDLNGFTEGCRTSVFAMRVAPIQVNYLGYPSTMGADYMDYLIASPLLIPAEHQYHYSEKIAYLPNNFMMNANNTISDKRFTRAELGLPEQGFIFCCFNNNYKINPEVFASWMRILHQVEDSVLWLLEDNDSVAINLRREATARGIAAERLVFAGRLPMSDYLARHRVADLFLDTRPYNAHTTSSNALWSGLPVLTCIGETFASRMAAGLLDALGLPELVTKTPEDYEALAIQLATHPEQLTALKQKLTDNRLTYPLFDTSLFTQHIESVYQAMFDRYQAGLMPEHI